MFTLHEEKQSLEKQVLCSKAEHDENLQPSRVGLSEGYNGKVGVCTSLDLNDNGDGKLC